MSITELNSETPVWQLTVGQLRELLSLRDSQAEEPKKEYPQTDNGKRWVRGIDGIANLFGCSKPTAQKLKAGIIKDAVYQQGRTIITDAEKAIQLFRDYKASENPILG